MRDEKNGGHFRVAEIDNQRCESNGMSMIAG